MDNILDLLTRKILDSTSNFYTIGMSRISNLYLTHKGFEIFNEDFKAKIKEYPFIESRKDIKTALKGLDDYQEKFDMVWINGLRFIIEKTDSSENTLIVSNFINFEKERGEIFLEEDIILRNDFPIKFILNMKKLW